MQVQNVNPEDGPQEIYVTWSDPRMTDFENVRGQGHSTVSIEKSCYKDHLRGSLTTGCMDTCSTSNRGPSAKSHQVNFG